MREFKLLYIVLARSRAPVLQQLPLVACQKTSRPSSPSSSRKGKTSPTRRSSEATQDENQTEGTIPPVPEESDEDAFGEDEPDLDRGLDAQQSWRKRRSKRKDEDDDDESDTSADMMKDLEI